MPLLQDVPLIKKADKPPSRVHGYVERVPTPLASPTEKNEFHAPSLFHNCPRRRRANTIRSVTIASSRAMPTSSDMDRSVGHKLKINFTSVD